MYMFETERWNHATYANFTICSIEQVTFLGTLAPRTSKPFCSNKQEGARPSYKVVIIPANPISPWL